MAAFTSPLADPAAASYHVEAVTVPAPLRYAGCRQLGLRIRAPGPGDVDVTAPADAGVRSVDADGSRWFELQPHPFRIRRVLAALRMGSPSFYFRFDPPISAVAVPAAAEPVARQGDRIGGASSITMLVVGQDRIARDPAAWAAELLAALRAGGTADRWEPFAAAVSAALAPPGAEPLMMYDHRGQPLTDESVQITAAGATTTTITLTPEDLGDLTRAAARIGAASPWSAGPALQLRRIYRSSDFPETVAPAQFAALEDGSHAADVVTVTAQRRHIASTLLQRWFAEQPVGAGLARYTRNNRIRFIQNGKPFFDEWFHLLATADVTNGGVHLTGWAMFNEALGRTRPDDSADQPVTIERLLRRIRAAGGGGRFLPTRFFQLGQGETVKPLMLLALGVEFIAAQFNREHWPELARFVDTARAALMANQPIVSTGVPALEPNRNLSRRLIDVDANSCVLSALPEAAADNPLGVAALAASDLERRALLNAALGLVNHFSVSHQKFSVIRTNENGRPKHAVYYGGIDFVAQQFDDVHHLAMAPYHDVQARLEGPAVRDVAVTFEQRWDHDASIAGPDAPPPLAFPTPTAEALAAEDLAPGPDCAQQVARTYFAPHPSAPTRALPFARTGDRTLLDTVLAAIGQAGEFIYLQDQYLTPPPEFQRALLNAMGNIRQLIITVPGQTDVPFGDVVRSDFITQLRARAVDTGTSLRLGYPRRHATLHPTSRAAAGGRLFLGRELTTGPGHPQETVVLKPKRRIPPPPFWILCEGEVMRVRSVTGVAAVDSTEEEGYLLDRGAATRLVGDAEAPQRRRHSAGAPVAVVDLTGIYVHCKMIVVDDVFLSHGSANCNRRGYYSDSELNVFTVPQSLRMSPDNPIADLRRRIWSEILNLPGDVATALMQDPWDAGRYFDRSPLAGNRYTSLESRPEKLTWAADVGDNALSDALQSILFGVPAAVNAQINIIAGDPSTVLERP